MQRIKASSGDNAVARSAFRSANDPFYTGDASGDATPTGAQLVAALADATTDRRALMARGVVDCTSLGGAGLQLDMSATRLIGDGLTLDFSGIAVAGQGVHLSGNSSGQNYGQVLRGVENVEIRGPGQGLAGWVGLLADGSTSNKNAARATLRGLVINGASSGYKIGNNSYGIALDGFEIYSCGICIEVPAGLSNAGELLDFYHGLVFNSDCGVSARNSGTDLNFYGCSSDYCKRLIETTSSQISWIGGHVEAGSSGSGTTDADVFIYCGQNSSSIDFRPATFVVASSRATYPIGYCQGSEAAYVGGGFGHTGGGVDLGGIHFQPNRMDLGRSSRTYDLSSLIRGGGRVTTGPYFVYKDGLNIPVAETLNQAPSGLFQSVSIGLHGFRVPDAKYSPPFIDTSQTGPDGTGNTLKLRTATPKTTLEQNVAPGSGTATVNVPGAGSVAVVAASWTAVGLQAALRTISGLGSTNVAFAAGVYTIDFIGAENVITGDVTVTVNSLLSVGLTPVTFAVVTINTAISAGAFSFLELPLTIHPGQMLQIDYWLKLALVTENGVSFTTRVNWLDADGLGISHTDLDAYAANTVGPSTNGFEHKQPVVSTPAPAGTRAATITWQAGTVDGVTAWPIGPSASIKYLVVNAV